MESIFFELSIVFMLILANGFFAGSELAIISARKGRIAALIEAGDGRARIVDEMQDPTAERVLERMKAFDRATEA